MLFSLFTRKSKGIDLINIVNNFLVSSFRKEVVLPWSNTEFRGSSLPFCPRKFVLEQIENKSIKHLSFEKRYSYHVGCAIKTLLHEMWVDDLWGDWRCSNLAECGIQYSNTFLKNGLCIRCGSSAYYVEKKLQDPKSGFSGQCDAIVFNQELRGFCIFEINSKNHNIISAAIDPYPSEIYQVSVFATLLSRIWNIPIVGRVVLWVGKPRPEPYKVWCYEGIGEDLANTQFQLKEDLDSKLKEGRFPDIIGICKTREDAKDCCFADVCFASNNEVLLSMYKRWGRGKSN